MKAEGRFAETVVKTKFHTYYSYTSKIINIKCDGYVKITRNVDEKCINKLKKTIKIFNNPL